MNEIAWAAGFFDGEGSSYPSPGKAVYTTTSGERRDYGGRYVYPKLTLSQNERVPLERFVAAVGEGNITGPYKSRPKLHHWNVCGSGAIRVMDRLLPFLSGPKRRQWEKVMEAVNSGP